MDSYIQIVLKKPLLFIFSTAVYAFIVIVLKWKLEWNDEIVWFVAGSLIGLYLIDFAETVAQLSPSPFRTGLFCYLFVITSLFVVSSSGNILASGLVLSMYLTMILWQTGHLAVLSHLDHWYRTITGPVEKRTQVLIFLVFVLVFIIESLLFIRS